MSKPTTKEKGDQFENEIANLLRFLPDSVVTQHVKISGKDVDILLEYTDPFSAKRQIAIDCKNYAKPMTRDAVSKEWTSYHPLVANQKVDSFWLVTRNDVVANAKEVFSDKSSRHFTSLDIQNLVLGPQRLIDDMERQFSGDNLDKYYVPVRGESIDINFYSEYFDIINSNFIKLASSRGSSQFGEIKALWLTSLSG
jgi:Restriction endonuclease